MTDLERRALLGDRQAQEECTRQGIVLPCPFCGSKMIKTQYLYFRPYIICEKCHAQITCYNTYPNAIEAWNRRAGEEEKNGV